MTDVRPRLLLAAVRLLPLFLLLVPLGCGAPPAQVGDGATTIPEPASGPGGAEPSAVAGAPPVTLFLVRHAEKASGTDLDPGLSEAGLSRARALAELLGDRRIDAVIASEFLRAQQTVEPLADRLGLHVEVFDAAAGDALAERLAGAEPGSRIVVAGHSNTIPALIAALGIEEPVEIPEERYGDLFVVRSGREGVTLERRRFGD